MIALELLSLFDSAQTGYLQALRVHPMFRGFGLASLLHSRLLSLAERVYHCHRVRETTSHGNQISIHLGRKHGLVMGVGREYDCGFFTREQAREMVGRLEKQISFLGITPSAEILQLETKNVHEQLDLTFHSSPLRRGRSSQVLSLTSQHPHDPNLILLRQYWMLYEVTEDNLVYLCSEVVLPPSENQATDTTMDSSLDRHQPRQRRRRRRRNLSAFDPKQPGKLLAAVETPYFLVVSPEEEEKEEGEKEDASAEATTPIGAFSISVTSKDHSGLFRTFSLYSPTPAAYTAAATESSNSSSSPSSSFPSSIDTPAHPARSLSYIHLLRHFHYHLRAALENRHETAEFRADDTGLPIAGTEYTERRYEKGVIENIQSSSPCWFSRVFQEVQEWMQAAEGEGGDDGSKSTDDNVPAGSTDSAAPSASAPVPASYRWAPSYSPSPAPTAAAPSASSDSSPEAVSATSNDGGSSGDDNHRAPRVQLSSGIPTWLPECRMLALEKNFVGSAAKEESHLARGQAMLASQRKYSEYVLANASRLPIGTWISIVGNVVTEYARELDAFQAAPEGAKVYFCREYKGSSGEGPESIYMSPTDPVSFMSTHE